MPLMARWVSKIITISIIIAFIATSITTTTNTRACWESQFCHFWALLPWEIGISNLWRTCFRIQFYICLGTFLNNFDSQRALTITVTITIYFLGKRGWILVNFEWEVPLPSLGPGLTTVTSPAPFNILFVGIYLSQFIQVLVQFQY